MTFALFFTIPSFYMNGTVPTLIFDQSSKAERAFNISGFQYTTASLPGGVSNPGPVASSSNNFSSSHGSTAAISANGSSNAIVWNINPQRSDTSDDLLAYNINLGTAIYDSGADTLTDYPTTTDTANKYSVVSVFNGMVYVGIGANWGTSGSAHGAIVGFGLNSSYINGGLFNPPTAAGGYYTPGGVVVSWTRNSQDETESEVDRSANGSTGWSVVGYVPNGANTFTDVTAVPGQTYYYRVRGISGSSTTSFATSAAVVDSPPTLSSAVSRKSQGGAGNFDIPLPLTGTAGVEDRLGGPTQLVFTFAAPVVEGSGFSVTLSSGAVSSTSVSGVGLTVNLSGAAAAQTLSITLNDVRDATTGASGNYTVQVGVLLGDINGDGSVNSADLALAKQDSGQLVGVANFRADLNADGAINVTDITLAGLNSGSSLPVITPALPADPTQPTGATDGTDTSNPIAIGNPIPVSEPVANPISNPIAAPVTPPVTVKKPVHHPKHRITRRHPLVVKAHRPVARKGN
jgi:hypothetical protein